jgi:hypothetical protein
MPRSDPAQVVADAVSEHPGLTARGLEAGIAGGLPSGVPFKLALDLARRRGLIYARGSGRDRQRHYPVPNPRSGHCPPEDEEALAQPRRDADDHPDPLDEPAQLPLFTVAEGPGPAMQAPHRSTRSAGPSATTRPSW